MKSLTILVQIVFGFVTLPAAQFLSVVAAIAGAGHEGSAHNYILLNN